MSNKNILILSALSFVAFLLFNKSSSLSDEIAESSVTLQLIETNGIALNDLKSRWDNKKQKKKVLRFLKNFKPRPKAKTRGDKTTFKFEPMTKYVFDKLTKKVLQSTIKIKKFEVEKVDDFRVQLILEVER